MVSTVTITSKGDWSKNVSRFCLDVIREKYGFSIELQNSKFLKEYKNRKSIHLCPELSKRGWIIVGKGNEWNNYSHNKISYAYKMQIQHLDRRILSFGINIKHYFYRSPHQYVNDFSKLSQTGNKQTVVLWKLP